MERTRPLTVVIIGAGLGGLACAIQCRKEGLDVIVLERAPQILPVGAGIQVPPNATRVMKELGILPELLKTGSTVEAVSLRRFEDGRVLARRPGGEKNVRDYGSPWIVIHRGDYHYVLMGEAIKRGVDIRLGCEVTSLDFQGTKAILADGQNLQGDVIIGADGLWSIARSQLLDCSAEPIPTGDLAYRGTFTLEELHALNDPGIEELCTKSEVTVWLGPDAHSVFYPVRSGKQFNLVLLRPDNLPVDARTTQGDLNEMREFYQNWDPMLTKIISCIPSVLKWKLLHHEELVSWTKGNVALLGDACHPTLPYQAQGAAMAVEDGVLIGTLLGALTRATGHPTRHIPNVLQLYEGLRKSRTTLNVQGAIENREMYHLHDGDKQRTRDIELGKLVTWNEDCDLKWADKTYNKQLLGFDTLADGRDAFRKWWDLEIKAGVE